MTEGDQALREVAETLQKVATQGVGGGLSDALAVALRQQLGAMAAQLDGMDVKLDRIAEVVGGLDALCRDGFQAALTAAASAGGDATRDALEQLHAKLEGVVASAASAGADAAAAALAPQLVEVVQSLQALGGCVSAQTAGGERAAASLGGGGCCCGS